MAAPTIGSDERPVVVDPERDRRFMAAALALARRNLGRAWPNPSVGAILVHETENGARVVGRGVTAPGGRPHAEVVALAEAGELARGATLYVTLEPCSHHGRTAPCSDALIAAGVARVVSAVEDPNPEVAGDGHRALAAAGIAVTVGVGEAEARRVNAGHISRVTRHRPHVLLKLAVSADGMIGKAGAGQVAITGPESRTRVHVMRARADAIAIGIETALNDDPDLTCRLPGMAGWSPVRVVFDTAARLPLASKLVRSAATVPVWTIIGEDAPADRRAALEAAGVTTIPVRHAGDGRIDLRAALETLAACGITILMVEGGARLASALVDGGYVDEATIFMASGRVGAGGIAALGDMPLARLTGDPAFEVVEARPYGADRMTRYWRKRES